MIAGLQIETFLHFFVLVVGFYMAWNIGANDVSNAMGTSVGSGALTLKRAVILAAILEFCGAYFVGANVSETMQRGLIDPTQFSTEPLDLILGMTAALLGTGLWLQLASYFGWPVSTTHAIVGAILGFGLLRGGMEVVQWEEVGSIALSWVISPVLSAALSYTVFTVLQRKILYALSPLEAARKFIPFFTFAVFATFTLSLIFNGLQNLDLQLSFSQALGIALLCGSAASLISFLLIKKTHFPTEGSRTVRTHTPQTVISVEKALKHLQRVRLATAPEARGQIMEILKDTKELARTLKKEVGFADRASDYHLVEKMFVYLQIVTACYVAFAHGANDVANAIGPVAAVLDVIKNGALSPTAVVPPWLLALGGAGIVIGLATWGWRVIETIGKKITELTPTRGFCAEFGAATTILLASKLGLPISTTHCLVGAVLGVGMGRGLSALNLSMVRDIGLSWIITIPASALMSVVCFYGLRFVLQIFQ